MRLRAVRLGSVGMSLPWVVGVPCFDMGTSVELNLPAKDLYGKGMLAVKVIYVTKGTNMISPVSALHNFVHK